MGEGRGGVTISGFIYWRDQRLLRPKSLFCVKTLRGRWTAALTAPMGEAGWQSVWGSSQSGLLETGLALRQQNVTTLTAVVILITRKGNLP